MTKPFPVPLLHPINLGPGMLMIHGAILWWRKEVRPGLPVRYRFSIWGGRKGGSITPLLPVLRAEMQGICGTGPRDWTEAAGGQGAQATERAAQSPGSPEREYRRRGGVSEGGPRHWGLRRKKCVRPGADGEGVSDYPGSTKMCFKEPHSSRRPSPQTPSRLVTSTGLGCLTHFKV